MVRLLRLLPALIVLLLVAAVTWAGFTLSKASTRPLALTSAAPGNVLILGYGGGAHPGAELSDTMLLVAQGAHGPVDISVPRDLWVQLPPNSGRYAKINAALQEGYDAGGLPAGASLSVQKVSQVVGLPIGGWVLENFQGFRDLIDAMGGVDVTVQRAFTAQYPVNDNPAINAAWKTIHFNAGPQHMDGERAIEFARARYSTNPLEGTDFARAARQQLLVAAMRSRLLSPAGALRFVQVTSAISTAITTNLSDTAMARFVWQLRGSATRHVTIDTSNVLVGARSADGQDILLPRGNNYGLIASYVQRQLS